MSGDGARRIAIAEPTIGEAELAAVQEPLRTGWLTQGPKVAEFEAAFAQRHRLAHALAVTSCTTALQLALKALDVGAGDQVIVPAFTWVATANVVVHAGATPVFVDVDPTTYNLRIDQVADMVTARTRAVIPVHLFGLCADVDALREVLPAGTAIIEDAACAVGAELRGVPAGGLGDIGAFSFHPRKIITTGEGGMLTTNDQQLAALADQLRNHGASISEEVRHSGPQPFLLPDFDVAGFNFRMTDLQGAIGIAQLQRLDDLLVHRERWAAWYTEQLELIEWLRPPSVSDGCRHSWQAYVTVVDEDAPVPRNELMARLHAAGVATRPGTHAVTELGYYRKEFSTPPGGCPVAAQLERSTMALPLHGQMTADDFAYVVELLT